MTFELVSPFDHQPLRRVDDVLATVDGRQRYEIVDDIPQLIVPDRVEAVRRFADDYAAVRTAEGRRSATADYYRALPHEDLSGNFCAQWQRRARTYGLLTSLLGPRPLKVIDAGAGNCWLSARLTALGHRLIAVDVNDHADDGLRANVHYPESFQVARSEITALPLAAESADVMVLNAAAHYLALGDVVAEASRVLGPGGRLIVADSPVYRNARSGQAMIEEMAEHLRSLGVEPAAHEGPGYLTEEDLDRSGLAWARTDVEGGRVRALRRRVASARAGRELATMPLLVATVGARHDNRVSEAT